MGGKFADVTPADWRALVEAELAGAPFDKLVQITAEGLAVQPLYTQAAADPGSPGRAPFTRGSAAEPRPFAICMRIPPPGRRRAGELEDQLEGGADALWIATGDDAALDAVLARRLAVVIDVGAQPPAEALVWYGSREIAAPRGVLACDPITAAARGALDAAQLPGQLEELARVARRVAGEAWPELRVARVSSVAFHDAGADAADELALVLASGVAVLGAMVAGGLDALAAASQLAVQVAVGRDTFGELCKLRALRRCWHKIFVAMGAALVPPPPVHAICSSRTQAQRDPWVNMLRVTTEVFAAALGGAELITPIAFDEALGPASSHGQRVARNTALVLREESHLGRVLDAGGGSYYLESRTDALAREAWSRFQAIERDGGIVVALGSGALRRRLDAAWRQRQDAIARRKEPVLGVSEFANLGERLPSAVPPPSPAVAPPVLAAHRDGEAFEALRARVAAGAVPDVALIALGPPAEHRGRTGYATALFATAGLAVREVAEPVAADIACICGSDERYAAEAVGCARALRAVGCRRIVVAGRPGPLEPALRAAGVDSFLFVGCDVVAALADLVELVAAPVALGGAS